MPAFADGTTTVWKQLQRGRTSSSGGDGSWATGRTTWPSRVETCRPERSVDPPSLRWSCAPLSGRIPRDARRPSRINICARGRRGSKADVQPLQITFRIISEPRPASPGGACPWAGMVREQSHPLEERQAIRIHHGRIDNFLLSSTVRERPDATSRSSRRLPSRPAALVLAGSDAVTWRTRYDPRAGLGTHWTLRAPEMEISGNTS